eukprot:UN13389
MNFSAFTTGKIWTEKKWPYYVCACAFQRGFQLCSKFLRFRKFKQNRTDASFSLKTNVQIPR